MQRAHLSLSVALFSLFIGQPSAYVAAPESDYGTEWAPIGYPKISLSDVSGHHLWNPDYEYHYKYDSRMLTGIPELDKTHFSGMAMKSDVSVRIVEDATGEKIEIGIYNIQHTLINGHLGLDLNASQPMTQTSEAMNNWHQLKMPEYRYVDYRDDYTYVQFEVQVSSTTGKTKLVPVSRSTRKMPPIWLIDMAKAIGQVVLGPMMVAETARKTDRQLSREEHMKETNMVYPGKDDIEKSKVASRKLGSSVEVFEESPFGHCLTSYNLVPAYYAREKAKSTNHLYELIRVRNPDVCTSINGHIWFHPGQLNCHSPDTNCQSMSSFSSITRYGIDVDSSNVPLVKYISVEGEVVVNPMLANTETFQSGTLQTFKYVSRSRTTKTQIRGDLYKITEEDKVRGTKLRKLISHVELKEEIFETFVEVIDLGLYNQSSIAMSKMPWQLMVLAEKMADSLNFDEIMYIYGKLTSSTMVWRGGNSKAKLKATHDLFLDTMLMAGNVNSLNFLINVYTNSNHMSDFDMSVALMKLVQSVRVPSVDYLESLVHFVTSDLNKEKGDVSEINSAHSHAILAVSSLLQEACLSGEKSFKFIMSSDHESCRHDSPVLLKRWLPYLHKLIREPSVGNLKSVALVASGYIQHESVMNDLLFCLDKTKVCGWTPSHSQLAIYSLMEVGKKSRFATTIQDRLLTIVEDNSMTTSEWRAIRIAAFNVMMRQNPSFATLQRFVSLAWRGSVEDTEFVKVIYGAFHSIANAVCRHPYDIFSSATSRKIHLLFPLLPKIEYHPELSSSFNGYSNDFLPLLDVGHSESFSWSTDGKWAFPTKFWYHLTYYLANFKLVPFEGAIQVEDFHWLNPHLIDILGGFGGDKIESDSDLESLIKKFAKNEASIIPDYLVPKVLFYVRLFERSPLFVQSSDMKLALKKLVAFLRDPSGQLDSWVNHVSMHPHSALDYSLQSHHLFEMPMAHRHIIYTDLGLPLNVEIRNPALFGFDFKSSVGITINRHLAIEADVTALGRMWIDYQHVVKVGTFCPITEQHVYTGYESHSLVNIPLDISVDFEWPGQAVKVIMRRSEDLNPLDLIHVHSMPFSVNQENKVSHYPFDERRDNFHRIIPFHGEDVSMFREIYPLYPMIESDLVVEGGMSTGSPTVFSQIYNMFRSYNFSPANIVRFFFLYPSTFASELPSLRWHEFTVGLSPTNHLRSGREQSIDSSVELSFQMGSLSKNLRGRSIEYQPIVGSSVDMETNKNYKSLYRLLTTDERKGVGLMTQLKISPKNAGKHTRTTQSFEISSIAAIKWTPFKHMSWDVKFFYSPLRPDGITPVYMANEFLCSNGSLHPTPPTGGINSGLAHWDKVVSEDVYLDYNSYIGFGYECHDVYVDVKSKISKSKMQKGDVWKSKVLKDYWAVVRKNWQLYEDQGSKLSKVGGFTPVASSDLARLLSMSAGLLDTVESDYHLRMPHSVYEALSEMGLTVAKVIGYEYLASDFYSSSPKHEKRLSSSGSPYEMHFKTMLALNATKKTYSLTISPRDHSHSIVFEDVPLSKMISPFMPISSATVKLMDDPLSTVKLSLTDKYVNSRCAYEAGLVKSFDGLNYYYDQKSSEEEESSHASSSGQDTVLLSADCTDWKSFAVTLNRTHFSRVSVLPSGEAKKSVHQVTLRLADKLKVEMENIDEGKSVRVTVVDGPVVKVIHDSVDAISKSGVHIFRNKDAVAQIKTSLMSLTFEARAGYVNLALSPLYRSRVCGVCGNMNGHIRDEYVK